MNRPRRTVSPIILLAIAFLAAAGGIAFGQSGPDAPVGGSGTEARNVQFHPLSVCFFPVDDLTGSEESARYASIVDSSVRTSLESLGLSILPDERWEDVLGRREQTREALSDGAEAVQIARNANAEMAISAVCYLEDGQFVLDLKAYDARNGRLVAGTFSVTRAGLTIYNRIDEAVRRISPQLELFLDPETRKEQGTTPIVLETVLTSPDEGMEVLIAGSDSVGTISGGELVLPFIPYPVGTKIRIEKRKEGYHTEEEVLTLSEPLSRIPLRPIMKKTEWAGKLDWTTGQFMGAGIGARYYLVPDYLFLAGSNYFYLQRSTSPESKTVLHNDLRFTVGQYLFFPHERRFRFGAGGGLGAVITRVPMDEAPWFIDVYLNAPNLWFEWNTRKWILFLQAEARYALGIGKNLLGADWLGDGPMLTLGVVRKW